MFKKIAAIVFILAGLMALPVLAAEQVAVFSPKAAILGSNTAKSRMKILLNSAEFKNKKQRFDNLKKEGKELIDKVGRDGDVLSTAKKNQIRAQLEAKEKELAAIAQEMQMRELKISQDLIKEMAPRLERAVKQVVKAKNIGLLLDRQLVVYAGDSFDITADVIQRLNQ